MNKLLIIMLSVALVSVGCSPANKKSSNSKPEAVKQSKPEAVKQSKPEAVKQSSSVLKQSSSVLKQSSSVLGDVDNQLVSSLANKKAPPLWEDYTKEDRVLMQEYRELLGKYSSPIYAVNNRIADFYEVQKKLDAIPKEDPSRKDERITLQKELRDILQDIRSKNTYKSYALGHLIDMPRLKVLDYYFTPEGSNMPSVSKDIWKLPEKVEVEKESDN